MRGVSFRIKNIYKETEHKVSWKCVLQPICELKDSLVKSLFRMKSLAHFPQYLVFVLCQQIYCWLTNDTEMMILRWRISVRRNLWISQLYPEFLSFDDYLQIGYLLVDFWRRCPIFHFWKNYCKLLFIKFL